VSGPRREASLAEVVRRRGGDLYDGGRRAVIPGPGHSRADRSVSLLLSGGRVVAHSFAGDDWRAILDGLRAEGLVDRTGRPGDGEPDARVLAPSRPERLAIARSLWDAARPVAGTLAEVHARGRGVLRDLSEAALRFHPAVPAAVYAGAGPRRPALMAAIREPSGLLCGVEVTYLAADGAAAPVAVPRKTVGGRPPGAAVRLDLAAPALAVGEGVFSCLSASQALGLPVWALLAVGNLAAWTPPPEVGRVVIAADRGRAGEQGAWRLARRLRAMGVATQVRLPPAPHADWNDLIRAEAREGGE
jgi:putative DNA primase/helicase